MTDTMEPLLVDGYEFSDARLSVRDSGALSAAWHGAPVEVMDESEVGESFEFRRLRRICNNDNNCKFLGNAFIFSL
jgi:hypothetical protein